MKRCFCPPVTAVITKALKTEVACPEFELGTEYCVVWLHKYYHFLRIVFPSRGCLLCCWCICWHFACFRQGCKKHKLRLGLNPERANTWVFFFCHWHWDIDAEISLFSLVHTSVMFKQGWRWFIVRRNRVAYLAGFIFQGSDLNQTRGHSTDAAQEET